MYYLLFVFYLAIAIYLINANKFIKKSALPPRIIIALFLLKIFAGLALGWITQRTYPGNDYWGSNAEGLVEYKLLISNPHEFFTNIFRSPYSHGYAGFFNSIGSYWNDLRHNLILKALAFSDIFSGGNFYINSLFFNFFGFFGVVALFRVFDNIYPGKKLALITGCFLLPSTLYFSSGIHKDLVVFMFLGLYSYALYFSTITKFTLRRSIIIFGCIAGIFLIRNYVAIVLIPLSAAYVISQRKRVNPLLIFTTVYGVAILSLLLFQLLIPSVQPLKIITLKQQDFLHLPVAATQVNMTPLEPTLKSFAKNSDQSFDHGFLRPYLRDNLSLLPLAIEALLYELLFFIVLLSGRMKFLNPNPFVICGLFFSITMLLITGFIIPNMGSIVRYRSIYLPFLLIPLLVKSPFKMLTSNIKF